MPGLPPFGGIQGEYQTDVSDQLSAGDLYRLFEQLHVAGNLAVGGEVLLKRFSPAKVKRLRDTWGGSKYDCPQASEVDTWACCLGAGSSYVFGRTPREAFDNAVQVAGDTIVYPAMYHEKKTDLEVNEEELVAETAGDPAVFAGSSEAKTDTELHRDRLEEAE